MAQNEKTAADENLQFFGRIVASVSHEIKNVMAIINEKAGLLKDLSAMVERGIPLDPNRIAGLADDLKYQIKRGDGIIKNMNRFAHSMDEAVGKVDVSELTGLITALSMRAASQKGAVLDFQPGEKALQVRTRPFLLQFLIWQCLQAAMESCGTEKSVKIRVEPCAEDCRIRVSLQDRRMDACAAFPPDSAASLIKDLNAIITIDEISGEIVLTVPVDADLRA